MSTIAPADPIRQKLLRGLNKEQTSAVLSTARRLLIIAGAGSGKTEVDGQGVSASLFTPERPRMPSWPSRSPTRPRRK